MTRASDELMAEVAQLAAWFHWPLGTLLDLEHHDRALFLTMIANEEGSHHADDPYRQLAP